MARVARAMIMARKTEMASNDDDNHDNGNDGNNDNDHDNNGVKDHDNNDDADNDNKDNDNDDGKGDEEDGDPLKMPKYIWPHLLLWYSTY
jgi:hypothetical protein